MGRKKELEFLENNKMKTKSPDFSEKYFSCPFCEVSSKQSNIDNSNLINDHVNHATSIAPDFGLNSDRLFDLFMRVSKKFENETSVRWSLPDNFSLKICQNCKKFSLWVDKKMVYPLVSTAPLPNEDMPSDVKKIYNEARNVQNFSPRATAALLRVALEKLTVHLGEKKGNLNTRIGNLKEKGLPTQVINALDIMRIHANESGSHSGKIDLEKNDNEYIVKKLFVLVNFIVEKTITDSNSISAMMEELPQEKKKGIDNRDKNISQ